MDCKELSNISSQKQQPNTGTQPLRTLYHTWILVIFLTPLKIRANPDPCELFHKRQNSRTRHLHSETSNITAPRKALEALLEKAATSKEHRSLIHQIGAQDAAIRLRPFMPKMTDEDFAAMLWGMKDSDMGKLPHGVEILKGNSQDSERLFKILSGKAEGLSVRDREAQEIIKTLAGGNLLSPDLSVAQLQNAIEVAPSLLGYLHELPGMLDAINDYKVERISKENFKIRIQANLFHNGPDEGYWRMLRENIVNPSLAKVDLSHFFKGTVFENGYPSPTNIYSAWHTLLDRLDIATGDGHFKIRAETAAFLPLPKLFEELQNSTAEGAVAQLKFLGDIGKKIFANTSKDAKHFANAIVEAQRRIEAFQAELKDRMSIEGNEIFIDGKRYTYESNEASKNLEEAWIRLNKELIAKLKPMQF